MVDSVQSVYGNIPVIQITLVKSSNGGVHGYLPMEAVQVSTMYNGGVASFLQ